MEYIREFKITVYMDTNKRTIDKSFTNIEDALTYLNHMREDGF